jgi:hypothetical protein
LASAAGQNGNADQTLDVAGFRLLADEEIIENICENEKDYSHMVGK